MKRLLLALLLLVLPATAEAALLRWPVEFAQPWSQISSSFGPRLHAADGYAYQFHSGIDIAGTTNDAVVAAAAGEVFRLYHEDEVDSPYPNSGNVVILKHELAEPLRFHQRFITTYYTLYLHLDSFAAQLDEGDIVAAGDQLGYIGQSGTTHFTHLHFEVRLGTTCSLRSACNTTGFDPHVHPLRFLDYPQTNHWRITKAVQHTTLAVTLRTRRNEADLNRLTVTTYNAANTVVAQRRHNFSTRRGFDTSTTQTLNDPLYRNSRLAPARYSTRSQYYRFTVRYRELLTPTVTHYTVQACDVIQHCTTRRWNIN